MPRLLYICEHLSTGGMPQYTLKQIETFRESFEITVVEVCNFGNQYVVQKNRIKQLASHHCLEWRKEELPQLVRSLRPDIIHFQELPESFLPATICADIFRSDREYTIVITTHSSAANPRMMRFLPDRFVLVNRWSQQQFQAAYPSMECLVWEYPIEERGDFLYKPLSPGKFNVLNIGLFTPGKNQGEIFQVARDFVDEPIEFHFVGNQAENFRSYWEPIMKMKPDNCKIWGERSHVEEFYQGADLFYFPSKLELNPLVVKEALSYRLPVLMRKLYTYLDDYDAHPLVHYIDSDLNKTQSIIREYLRQSQQKRPLCGDRSQEPASR